ncbi:MAG: FtsX-like permease family protein, partial [Spirochaetia bacterium]
MGVLLRIALRNLLEHKGKTLIIGSIVALGVVVLVVGNALMDTARTGIERAFINNYTGDIMVAGLAEGNISLFGVQSIGGLEQTPVIPEFIEINDYLNSVPQIADTTTQISGFGFLRAEDDRIDGIENSAFTVLFGIDPSSYRRMFDNLELVAGSYLEAGAEGVMLSADRVEDLEKAAVQALEKAGFEEEEFEIHAGDDIRVVSGLSQGLPRIRVVPLVGIYEMTGISEGVGAEFVTYIDAQTLRALLGLSLGTGSEIELEDEQTELLDRVKAGGSDFLQEEFFSADPFGDDLFGDSLIGEATGELLDFENLEGLLHTAGPPTGVGEAPVEIDAGTTWHYFLARVENPRRTNKVVAELNEWFISRGISAQAGNWEMAAGPFATTADVVRTVFNIAILIIGIVAVIIIMNTMVISVMERTSEIGTMRALGAQRGFVWRMFMVETLVITSLFGLIGVATGLGIIGILHLIGVPAT